MGPSLGHFDTHENVSFMLFHESKAAVDPSLSLQIEVNITAASAEAAASFAELCNTLVKKLNTGPFLEVHSYGSLVTVLSMPLQGDTASLKQELTMIMKHIGHVTYTVSANNNIEHMMAHPDDSIWNQAKTGTKIMLDATLTDAVEKALVEQMKQRSHHEVECPTMEAPCVDVNHPDSCCSRAKCLAFDAEDNEEERASWKESQCKYNQTCAPLCGGSAVAKTPTDYALAMSEKLMQIFTGGSVDVRVAYDDEIVKGISASLPGMNMTFRSLQEQYRSLAHQHHLEKFASHPLAAAGVEVMNAVNRDLVSIESVELKNLPSDIRFVVNLENAKPFQFIFALLEGSGILGMLAGAPEPSPAKQKGIMGLAGFLKLSKRLVVLWSPRYFTRLWCVYEIATWTKLRKSLRQLIIAPVAQGLFMVLVLVGVFVVMVMLAGLAQVESWEIYATIVGSVTAAIMLAPLYAVRNLVCDLRVMKIIGNKLEEWFGPQSSGIIRQGMAKELYLALAKSGTKATSGESAQELFDRYVQEVFGHYILKKVGGSRVSYWPGISAFARHRASQL
eukprot:s539_g10.t1